MYVQSQFNIRLKGAGCVRRSGGGGGSSSKSAAGARQRQRGRKVEAAAAFAPSSCLQCSSSCWHRPLPIHHTRRRRSSSRLSAAAPSTQPPSAAAAEELAEPLITERELTVKLSVAGSTGRLDLSDLRLPAAPEGLFDLVNLEELSLAGNALEALPDDGLAQLTALRRLVIAGNRLSALPARACGVLAALEGLWAHGNALEALPDEIGDLAALKSLSVAGNRLTQLPDSIGRLSAVEDLSVSGNALEALPAGVAALPALKRLAAGGNALRDLPAEWGACGALEELHLQGNLLTSVPDSLGDLPALQELSLADNALEALPGRFAGWRRLQKLYLYGNRLRELPVDALLELPALQQLWLEGNPLSPECVHTLLERVAAGAAPPQLKAIGVDADQLAGVSPALLAAARAARPGLLRIGRVCGAGPGYFKLQYGAGGSSSSSNSSSSSDSGSSDNGNSNAIVPPPAPVLVVAFGSAPGLPNWGGALRAASAALAAAGRAGAFDTLFVVDARRDWYCGGDAAAFEAAYGARLAAACRGYQAVIMVGDSMGATGALLAARHATSVLAFCPQVDLTTASIRPGRPDAWLSALTANVHAAVADTNARVRVLTGTWAHDLQQAALLERHPRASLKAYGADTHRLALALARAGKLAPLLSEEVAHALPGGAPARDAAQMNVRLANLL